jgi:ankyrin repeat protein
MSRRLLRKQLIQAIETGDMAQVAAIAADDPTIVNAANSHGHAPLGAAVGTGCLKRVEFLVHLGANPRHVYHGRTLLDAAAFAGHGEIFRYLVALGLQPTVHHAAAIGDITLLARMLEADPALRGPSAAGGRWRITPLQAAVIGGNDKAVAFLVTRGGVFVDAENHNGHTALALVPECSVKHTRAPIAEMLLAHGANANAQAGHHGGTVLHRAVIHGDAALARVLLEHRADPDRQDQSGKTPLHHAVSRNRQLAALLMEYQPNLALHSRDGETPVQYARRLQKQAIARLLDEAI